MCNCLSLYLKCRYIMKNKNESVNVESFFYVIKNNLVFLFIAILLIIPTSLYKPFFLLDQNQILYLFSASAQVLAAIYGLVLTASSLVQESIKKRGVKDPDLEGIWERMTQESFKKLIYISIMTFLSIVFCMITMSSCDKQIICRIFINISTIFVVNDLYLIIKFVIRFANPKWEDAIREKVIKEHGVSDVKNDGLGNNNSVQEFLAYFQKIERALGLASAPFISYYNGYSKSKFVSIREKATILLKYGYFKENYNVYAKILDLIPFRNSLVHSSIEQGVPESMMDLAKDVLKGLENSLKDKEEFKKFKWDVK